MSDISTNEEVSAVVPIPYIRDNKQERILITPHLYDLPIGTTHSVHIIYINPIYKNNGMTASGHWDPNNTQNTLGHIKLS